MRKSGFGGPQAVRMILDKMPSAPGDKELDVIAHLRFATVEDITGYQFSQDEIDAITDLLMQHFDVTGFVADTAITYLTDKSPSGRIGISSDSPPVSE
jgi:hypothetical protein